MADRQNPGGKRAQPSAIGIAPDTQPWNPDLTLTWSNGELVQIDESYGGVTVRQTLTWSNGELQTLSAWSEV